MPGDAFATEEYDAIRSAMLSERLQEAAETGFLVGTQVDSVECRETMCVLHVSHETADCIF